MRFKVYRVNVGYDLVPDVTEKKPIGTANTLDKAMDIAENDNTGLQKRIRDTMNKEWLWANDADRDKSEQMRWF